MERHGVKPMPAMSASANYVSLGQLKVMSAIENCRTAALGGHVARCENEKCAYTQIASAPAARNRSTYALLAAIGL